jgi:hypothetical protein
VSHLWKPAAQINQDNPALPYRCVFELSDGEVAPLRVYGKDEEEIFKRSVKVCKAVNHHDELMQVIGESVDMLHGDPSPEAVDAVRAMLNQVWWKVKHEA